MPEDPASHGTLGTELATLSDGLTYVSLPDGAVLPMAQPGEIAQSIAPVNLSDALRAELKLASPHVRLINERVRQKIGARYSIPDELKMLRLAPSPESAAYNAFVEECREWGRVEKAALGL